MTIDVVIIMLLVVIVALQQGFYMWQVNKLVNKLMSRDFHSYTHTVNPPAPQGFHIQLPQEEEHDRLKELNRRFPS